MHTAAVATQVRWFVVRQGVPNSIGLRAKCLADRRVVLSKKLSISPEVGTRDIVDDKKTARQKKENT